MTDHVQASTSASDALFSFTQPKGLALGATAITGHPGGQANADDLVRTAWDSGVRYYDTAPMYGGGRSEELLGHALRPYPRDAFTLSSKVGRLVRRDEPILPLESELWRYDFSRDGIRRSVDESLARLGTDRLDLAYIHDPDAFIRVALTESHSALEELRDEGVIGAIGVGITHADTLAKFIDLVDLDAVLLAGRLSLVDGEASEQVLPLAAERGVAVVIASALHAGLVDGADSGSFHYQPTPTEIVDRVARIKTVCDRHDVPIGAAALQFVLAIPEVSMVLTGTADAEQWTENLAWSRTPIPAALWAELDADALLSLPLPTALTG